MMTITMMMKIIITPVNESPCEVKEVGGSPVAAPSHSCEHKYKVNCIWKYGCVYTINTKKTDIQVLIVCSSSVSFKGILLSWFLRC